MKPLAFFLVWTLVFWMLALALGGQIAKYGHAFTHVNTDQPDDMSTGIKIGMRAGLESRRASLTFIENYWLVVLAGASMLAGTGSISGILPGTGRPKASAEPPPLPPH